MVENAANSLKQELLENAPSEQPGGSAAMELARTVERATGENAFLCYQCARCSSGCPVVEHMDAMPNQVMRAVQLNDRSILQSKSIWLCASCQTCTTRCPQNLDVAAIMDALRIEAKASGLPPAIPDVDLFSRLFLGNVDLFGRVYELGLMASMNMMSGKPFANMALGGGMLKRGKLKFFPSVTRPPKQVETVAAHPNTVAYYPGCSLHSTAREYDRSIRRVMESLDLELVEPPGWVCCGSSPAHTSDPKRATLLPVQNLQTVERMGLDAVTAPCSACFARMKTAAHTVAHNPEMAREVERETGFSYGGSVKVKSLVETLLERAGPEKVATQVKKKLTGLKVACYYGCLMTRPPQILEAEHPEYPTQIEELIAPLGAETVDWSYKTDCCGGTLGLTQTDVALELTAKILRNARDCGADIVVTACPLCHVNLDARQSQIGLDFQMPVLYLTQLMALAFGYEEKETGLNKNFVDPAPVLARTGG
jgi:heterodisulfide reductase subunit B